MSRRSIIIISLLLFIIASAFLALAGGPGALLVGVIVAGVLLAAFRHYVDDKEFVSGIFLAGLLARMAFGFFVHVYDLREFFGGDAKTYDRLGDALLTRWIDPARAVDPFLVWALDNAGSGWGMNYL